MISPSSTIMICTGYCAFYDTSNTRGDMVTPRLTVGCTADTDRFAPVMGTCTCTEYMMTDDTDLQVLCIRRCTL